MTTDPRITVAQPCYREATKGPEACEVRRWRALGVGVGTDATDVISGCESDAQTIEGER